MALVNRQSADTISIPLKIFVEFLSAGIVGSEERQRFGDSFMTRQSQGCLYINLSLPVFYLDQH